MTSVRARGTPRRLLVLGAGPGQLGLLEAARRRGLVVVAADRDPAAPGLSYADRRAIVSIEDEPAVERLARAENVDGVVAPGSDHAVALAARIAARLALPHPVDPDSALLSSSRRRQRERLADAGVAQPRSILCRSASDAVAAADELGYPCVVEAPDGPRERGVVLAPDRDALVHAAAEALAESRDSHCLVEELVGERLVTLSGFLVHGTLLPLLLTDREQASPPAFGVPLVHLWPAALTDAEREDLLRLVGAAVDALELRDGPLTAQVLVTPRGPLLAKVSARTGGHDGDLCRATLGVGLDEAAVSAALGEPVTEAGLRPVATAGGACVRFLVAPPGELRASVGEEDARDVPGVRLVRTYRQPGHRFHALRRASDRAGAIVAVGGDVAAARRAAEAAAARIELVTEPVEAAA